MLADFAIYKFSFQALNVELLLYELNSSTKETYLLSKIKNPGQKTNDLTIIIYDSVFPYESHQIDLFNLFYM